MTLRCRCLSATYDAELDEQFVMDGATLTEHADSCAAIVLADGKEARAHALLDAGARRVLIGEAALIDGAIIERLAEKYGKQRVGLYVPVSMLAVDWSFETVSNADFKVVTPSICEPTWEILRADGSGTGTHADWWIGQMLARGAQMVLLRADIKDDTDLNLCAGLVEKLGDQLWITPLPNTTPPLSEWIEFGRVGQLALPPDLYQRRGEWPCLATLKSADEALMEAS